jgi:hypothetical protein
MTATTKPLTDPQRRALLWARSVADGDLPGTLNRPRQAVLDRLRDAKLITFDMRRVTGKSRITYHLPSNVNITAAGRAALVTRADLGSLTVGQQVRLPYGSRAWINIESISALSSDEPRRRTARVRRAGGQNADDRVRDSYVLILHDYSYVVRGVL